MAAIGKATKREPVDTGGNKLYVRRNARGTSFKEVEDVGRSPARDRRQTAKAVAPCGQGDKGDRRRQSPAGAAGRPVRGFLALPLSRNQAQSPPVLRHGKERAAKALRRLHVGDLTAVNGALEAFVRRHPEPLLRIHMPKAAIRGGLCERGRTGPS
jgi:hypothetical protein